MHLYRRMVAKRVVYIYIMVVLCLFVVHFKLSQDYLLSPNSLYRYCNKCLYAPNVEDENNAFNNSNPSSVARGKPIMSLGQINAERKHGFIGTSVKETTRMRKQNEGSIISLDEISEVEEDKDNKDGNRKMQEDSHYSNPKVLSGNVDLQSSDNKLNKEPGSPVQNKNVNPKASPGNGGFQDLKLKQANRLQGNIQNSKPPSEDVGHQSSEKELVKGFQGQIPNSQLPPEITMSRTYDNKEASNLEEKNHHSTDHTGSQSSDKKELNQLQATTPISGEPSRNSVPQVSDNKHFKEESQLQGKTPDSRETSGNSVSLVSDTKEVNIPKGRIPTSREDLQQRTTVFQDTDKKEAVHVQQQKTSHSRVPMLNATKPRVLSYKPPPNEKPVKRFPQGLIIGFAKCGTRALLEFLALHPYVVHHKAEMHFYDRDDIFKNGFDWYKEQMPPSYSNQVTVEKTPAYITHQRARDEIHRLTPDVKLIVLVRDPVVRLVSQFNQRYRDELSNEDIPIQAIYRNKLTGEFNQEYRPVVTGIYYRYLAMWLERFPLKQFLILNAEHLSENPLPVLKRVENFLEIPPMFTERNVYFNESSGFYCPRGFERDAIPDCLWKTKGLDHRNLPKGDEKMLYEFYRPLNEKFFRLAGRRFEWKEREWERYQ